MNANVLNCCGGHDVSPPLLLSLFVRTNPISPRCGESISPPRHRGGGSKAPVQHSDFRKRRLKSQYPEEGTFNMHTRIKFITKYVPDVALIWKWETLCNLLTLMQSVSQSALKRANQTKYKTLPSADHNPESSWTEQDNPDLMEFSTFQHGFQRIRRD